MVNKIGDGIMAGCAYDHKTIPFFDYLCLFPIVQQVVGLGGMAIGFIQVIANVAYRCFKEAVFLVHGKEKRAEFRKQNNEARNQHLSYIAFNILRLTPVIGSLVSLAKIYRPLGC